MSGSGEILLFDLPSRPPCRAWSPNTLRVRMLLNFKGLDYKTEWIEYPEIKTRLEGHVPAHETNPPYTVPTIKLPDGTYLMDSWKIVEFLEKQHPSPSVYLDSPSLPKLRKALEDIDTKPIRFPLMPEHVLSEGSLEYWDRTRSKDAGMPLEQFGREKGGARAYDSMRPALEEITSMLAEDTSGPFFLGNKVSLTDFTWAAMLIFCRRMGDDVLGEVLKRSGNEKLHRDFLAALEPWTKRDDH